MLYKVAKVGAYWAVLLRDDAPEPDNVLHYYDSEVEAQRLLAAMESDAQDFAERY